MCFTCLSLFLVFNFLAGCENGKKKVEGKPCEKCAPGYFTDERDLLSCKQCPKGYYTNDQPSNDGEIRLHRCQGCPRGSWGNQMAMTTVSGCQDCTAGMYNDVEANMLGCKDCPKGTYSTATKNMKDSDCTNCGSGKYSSTLAASSSTSCIKCVSGKKSPTVGAISESACIKCEVGYEMLQDGMSYCLPCTPGRHGMSNDDGFAICRTCPNNYYSAATEQVRCHVLLFFSNIFLSLPLW